MGKIWAGLIKIRVDGVHDPKIVSPQTVGRPREFGKNWSEEWCRDNAKLAGCSQGRSSQSGRRLLESGNFPFVCCLNLAPSIP